MTNPQKENPTETRGALMLRFFMWRILTALFAAGVVIPTNEPSPKGAVFASIAGLMWALSDWVFADAEAKRND